MMYNSAFIANSFLRKSICRKVAERLQRNLFQKEKAEELALIIEANIRRKDPYMGAEYRRLVRIMLKDIKQLLYPEYHASLPNP